MAEVEFPGGDEDPNESAWNEEAVEGQLEELDLEELEELEDDEAEGVDDEL